MRDTIMEGLGTILGFNIDEHLNTSEAMRRDRGEEGITLLPWMKAIFKFNDPDQPQYVPGLKRTAILREDDKAIYRLNEVEFPYTNPEGNRWARILYYARHAHI
jgi:hypothetical protein